MINNDRRKMIWRNIKWALEQKDCNCPSCQVMRAYSDDFQALIAMDYATEEVSKLDKEYGGGGTYHQTGYVDVEVEENGQVVSVWFRCMPLPFRQSDVTRARAAEMKRMYKDVTYSLVGIHTREKDK